jgi:hypothetical protein
LPQKWPLQKPQSPTIRCACSLQFLKLQRGFRPGAIVVFFFGIFLGSFLVSPSYLLTFQEISERGEVVPAKDLVVTDWFRAPEEWMLEE